MTTPAPPTRPALRYYGGKWLLAPWIIEHLPRHRIYVEPYGGAASVLLRKPRSYAEIYNDLDGDVVALFRVLRDPATAAELRRALELTPFSRAEFELSYERADNPLEATRRLMVCSYMGFGANANRSGVKTGFRSSSFRNGTTADGDWRNLPSALDAITERLRGVVIEHKDAMDVMAKHDSPDTLHYVDPPYLEATRGRYGQDGYNHEMTEDEHEALLILIDVLKGMIVLSGYPSEMYNQALAGWCRVERPAYADGARARTEVLWLNEAAASRLTRGQHSLFDEAS